MFILLSLYDSYSRYNYSAPRIPPSLKFSSQLRPVTNLASQTGSSTFTLPNGEKWQWGTYANLANASFDGLRCESAACLWCESFDA